MWGVLEGLKVCEQVGVSSKLEFRAMEVKLESLVVANYLSRNGYGISIGRSLVALNHKLMLLEWKVVVKHS